MTKTGSTKNKILKIIASGNYTLSDISASLALAPSTVSQHLQELKDMGAIQEVDNPYVKKWKYYKINPQFNQQRNNPGVEMIKSRMAGKIVLYSGGIIAVAVAAYLLFAFGSSNVVQAQTGAMSYIPLKLTDPPHVPNGTQALFINYSSIAVHTVGQESSQWTSVNSSGRIDLMSLVNFSQVIGEVQLSSNAIVDAVRFNITAASVEINGTNYSVSVPESQITAKVVGIGRVNASSGILLDLSPTVTDMYANNSTVFVLLPSIKAVIESNSIAAFNTTGKPYVGEKAKLDQDEMFRLYSAKENISIAGASLVAGGYGNVSLQLSLKNNGNQSVNIEQIIILGNETPSITLNDTCAGPMIPANNSSASYPCCNGSAVGLNKNMWCRIIMNNGIGVGAGGNFKIHAGLGQQNELPRVWANGSAYGGSNSTFVPINSSPFAGSGRGQRGAGSGQNNIEGQGVVSVGAGNFRVLVGNKDQGPQMPSGPRFNSSTYNAENYSGGYGNGRMGVRLFIGGQNGNIMNAIENGSIAINQTFISNLVYPTPKMGGRQGYQSPAIIPVLEYYRGIDFSVEQNGTLQTRSPLAALPMGLGGQMQGGLGYNLSSGTTASFSYNGSVSPAQGEFRVSLVPGARYRVVVIGDYGAYAVANITASGS